MEAALKRLGTGSVTRVTTAARDRERLFRCAASIWGGARVALGVVAMTAPTRVARPWIGADADTVGGLVFGRVLGGRDIALGAGVMYAALRGERVRPWALASGFADLGDVVVTGLHRDELPTGRRAFIAALAGGSALAAVALAFVESDPS